jgi:chorismate mutase
MTIRGIRGAITVSEDQPEQIRKATCELLEAILKANGGMNPEEIASVFFTVTDDLNSAFPAQGAREMGWEHVPMICAREIPVPNSLPHVIRVLIHWNTDCLQSDITHVYFREAVKLRPDLMSAE